MDFSLVLCAWQASVLSDMYMKSQNGVHVEI